MQWAAPRFAAKGCTLVEAQKDGSTIQIAGTHLQAGKSEKAQIQRDMQYSDIHGLLERNKTQTIPVILLGDLNTKKWEKDTINFKGVVASNV